MASTLSTTSSSASPSSLHAKPASMESHSGSRMQCRHQFTLQSPTRKSVFRFSTGSPIGKAELVQKVTRTNLQQQTETTLYTIAVTRPLPRKGSTQGSVKSKVAAKAPSTLDLLTAAAVSELSKPGMQSPRLALRSLENFSQSHGSSQIRLKSLSSGKPSPITFKILPSTKSAEPAAPSETTSIKRFSFVFQ